MNWHWQSPRAADSSTSGLGQRFPSQAEAEAWLTESFPDLVEAGITEVSLFEGDRLVYGPMSLLPGGPA